MFVDSDGTIIPIDQLEVVEQEQSKKYIKKNHRVLELGARFGTVSCIINKLLDDPTAHVAVEPDSNVIHALEINRDAHGCKFHIIEGVITSCNMKLRTFDHLNKDCAYGNFAFPVPEEYSDVKSYSLDFIQRTYGYFNCLVADCEGFLEQFLRENPHFLKQVDTVIMEKDGPERCNYEYVDNCLKEAGLVCIVDGFHAVWTVKEETL
jgi:FkbM family methyltransferase